MGGEVGRKDAEKSASREASAQSAGDGSRATDTGLPSARDALPPRPPAPASGPDSLQAARQPPSAPPAHPVRPARPPAARPGGPPPSVREVAGAVEVPIPTREVTVDDRVWLMQQKGSSRIGYGRGSGARILSVGFEARTDGENPDATRYVLARSLNDVTEEELVSLVREVIQAPGPDSNFSGPGRRSPGRGRRSRGYRRRGGRWP